MKKTIIIFVLSLLLAQDVHAMQDVITIQGANGAYQYIPRDLVQETSNLRLIPAGYTLQYELGQRDLDFLLFALRFVKDRSNQPAEENLDAFQAQFELKDPLTLGTLKKVADMFSIPLVKDLLDFVLFGDEGVQFVDEGFEQLIPEHAIGQPLVLPVMNDELNQNEMLPGEINKFIDTQKRLRRARDQERRQKQKYLRKMLRRKVK